MQIEKSMASGKMYTIQILALPNALLCMARSKVLLDKLISLEISKKKTFYK
jgi:hypothetical protein